jgi:hypothetical protein
VVTSRVLKIDPPAPIFGDKFLEANASGSSVDQLEAEYIGQSQRYPGTLVILVGHFADKLRRLLEFYQNTVDISTHYCFVAFNGDAEEFEDLVRPVLPYNCICEPMFLDNVGWDIRMYAAGALSYAFDRYFFINDDTLSMAPGWLEDFEKKSMVHDLVGIQGVGFIRTTYFGSSRLLWLATYVATEKKVVDINWRRMPRRMRPMINKYKAHHAHIFEGTNTYICHRLGYKFGFLDNKVSMRDTYCLHRRCLTWASQAPSFIRFGGAANGDRPLTIDFILNVARARDEGRKTNF